MSREAMTTPCGVEATNMSYGAPHKIGHNCKLVIVFSYREQYCYVKIHGNTTETRMNFYGKFRLVNIMG